MKLKELSITIVIIAIGIVFLPLLLLYLPVAWIKNKRFEKEFTAYLKEINGKNFFCYNNRRKGFDYIKNEILPFLPSGVEPIFLNGKQIESDIYDTRYISKVFYSFKNYNRFPQILKIRNGKMIDCSVNREMFACINQGKDKEVLFNKIECFFEINNK
jgi:hypothetical protein